MADQLYLNLWFPSFNEQDMLPRLLSVLKQFPFSEKEPGVTFVGVHPVSFAEQPILTETFDFGVDPEKAASVAAEFVHSDYAYEIEVAWDLWVPVQEGELDQTWQLRPMLVSMIAYGVDFDEHSYQQNGHIQLDFGLDTPFIQELVEYSPEVERRIKANTQKLIVFTQAIEKNCGISGRILWSESDEHENLAQKLISRLQRVQ